MDYCGLVIFRTTDCSDVSIFVGRHQFVFYIVGYQGHNFFINIHENTIVIIFIHMLPYYGEIVSLSYNITPIMVQNDGIGLKLVYNGVEIIYIPYI